MTDVKYTECLLDMFLFQVRYDDPRFRSAEAGPTLGHYWRNGQEIQNTEDYVEEVNFIVYISL